MSKELRDREYDKFGEVNGATTVKVSSVEELSIIDADNTNLIYFGTAEIGSLESDLKWKISRLTITGSVFKFEYANKNAYVSSWANRGILIYE